MAPTEDKEDLRLGEAKTMLRANRSVVLDKRASKARDRAATELLAELKALHGYSSLRVENDPRNPTYGLLIDFGPRGTSIDRKDSHVAGLLYQDGAFTVSCSNPNSGLRRVSGLAFNHEDSRFEGSIIDDYFAPVPGEPRKMRSPIATLIAAVLPLITEPVQPA